ncbi:MAG: hypothetical protein OEY49_11480 [Candidatus Heimdallarchaeota archaeon]|nr:hypothetical protein [Candidatus Heimdallarchaeota archaeon]
MIHLLLILDKKKQIGQTLFDNGIIKLQTDLLIGLVHALILLGEEMGQSKGALREAELGKYQIGILTQENLLYVVVQDTYDSEPFTRKIIQTIIDKFHPLLLEANLNYKIKNIEEISDEIANILITMKFPIELLDVIDATIEEFIKITNNIFDVLFLADLDDGIVKVWKRDNDDKLVKLLLEILSEIPFERQWIGSTRLLVPKIINQKEVTHEAWIIYRIGLTDFCILGRGYYIEEAREHFEEALNQLVISIYEILQNNNVF